MNDTPTTQPSEFDVLVLGGGIAGLTLAYQLKNKDPEVEIAVAEKSKFPVPEAAHKVGESTLPVSSRYFLEVLGLGDHLKDQHLRKLGIRFFGTAEGNRDISQRPELGLRRWAPLPSFQLDRGRLENELRNRIISAGVKLIDDVRVTEVDLGDPLHVATLTHADGSTEQIAGRWLVDASGKASILKHKLRLAKPAPHTGNATWLRIADRIAVDDWTDDEEWQSRVPSGERWTSTVHLHGDGYWAWLIPLGSGSTSVGLVTDPELVPFERMRRLEPLLEWLYENEPQLAAEVDKRKDLIQDFRTRKDYPKNCEQVYSPDRWFITGDAGIFMDPLYSPGMELISISNTTIVDLICKARTGVDISAEVAMADLAFRGQAELLFGIYTDQYRLFGNAEVMSAKVVWESISYFGTVAPIAFGSDSIEDPMAFFISLAPELGHASAVSVAFHKFLADWHAAAGDTRTAGMMTVTAETMDRVHTNLIHATNNEHEIVELIKENAILLQESLAEMVEHVAQALGFEPPSDREWTKDPEALARFRLIELPRPGVPTKTVPPESSCGVIWATDHNPDGAACDHMAAWQGGTRGIIYPEPVKFVDVFAATPA